MQYIPSGSSVGSVLNSLSEYLKEDLVLPGNWSPQLFFEDLKRSPAKDKKSVALAIKSSIEVPITYLYFFESTRGYPRALTSKQKELCELFDQGSIMLYFESLFLQMFNGKETKEDKGLLTYLRVLSRFPISKWNDLIEGLGACSYQYFAQDPHSYAKLLSRVKDVDPEDLMDKEILEVLPEAESFSKNRAELIRRYREAQI